MKRSVTLAGAAACVVCAGLVVSVAYGADPGAFALDTHLERAVGACCDDRSGECTENWTDAQCAALGGRFLEGGTCADLDPLCGEALGACCYDDGTCELLTFQCCESGCIDPCYGDLNCDGVVSFADINPFVLYLSNFTMWGNLHPDCLPENGDLNGDGVFPAFSDINPFVALLSGSPQPIVCTLTTKRWQGAHWAGPGTTCDPWPAGGCCTVVVPPGAVLENEPNDCADHDVFNGGCNMSPPLFSPIPLNTTVYGESYAGSGTRDMDWYRFTLADTALIAVRVEAEFDPVVSLYRAGPAGPADCDGARDVACAVIGTRCSPTVLSTRCMMPGTYCAVVAPAAFDGVACQADYKITVEVDLNVTCDPCMLPACPAPAHVENASCDDAPGGPDPNGGCNVTPHAFEPLELEPGAPLTVCGTVWANSGTRDTDWYAINLAFPTSLEWEVDTEVPIRATLLFDDLGNRTYGPPNCSSYYYWTNTLVEPCVHKSWTSSVTYASGTYWFVVWPEDESGGIYCGYPCPMGSAELDSDYQITFGPIGHCDWYSKPHANTEAPEALGPGYVDAYDSGCDAAAPPGPVLPLTFGSANAWQAQSGTWFEGSPQVLKKDYDWYEFTLTTAQRFKVYLYTEFYATWEIWPADDCASGPLEGLDVPCGYYAGFYTVRCFPAGTYWLRVYPTYQADIGKHYYLALTEQGSCSACSYTCSGSDLDDPCDDVTFYDTNAGCDTQAGAPPPHYMNFECDGTYCGRASAREVNGVGHFDPDWFEITQTNATAKRFRLTVSAEFIAHVEAYASCTDYDAANPIGGLDAITTLAAGTQCPNMIISSTSTFPQGTTIYGRITIVDQLGNLATDYYPCANAHNRWKIAANCVN